MIPSNINETKLPGKSEKIIDFPSCGDQITVHHNVIDKILNRREISARKVVAVSIVGAFRKGKSFLLDYFLRYLYFTYRSVNTFDPETHLEKAQRWIGMAGEKLTGFSWRKGTKRETTGIVLWSDVFLYDADDGEKFAILLIDTQRLFDHDTPEAINSKIFSFTTLISSIQIHNFPNQVQENDLQYLHFATEFAKFSLEDGGAGKPFEHLMFVIRDWVNSSEYENGFDGGFRYMEENFLKIRETQKDEMKEMRKFIKESFDKISCFLMPRPGESIHNEDFNGSWTDLKEDFVKQLENLLPGILSPENLKAKKINGQDATVFEYLVKLKIYAEAFSSNEIPSAQTIYESNVVHFMNQLVKKCVDSYLEKISAEKGNIRNFIAFDNLHLRIKEQTILMYTTEKKMGSETHATFSQNQLVCEIQKNYDAISSELKSNIQNKILKDEKRAAEDKAFKIEKEKKEQDEKLEYEKQKREEMLFQQQENIQKLTEISNKLKNIEEDLLSNKFFALKIGPIKFTIDNIFTPSYYTNPTNVSSPEKTGMPVPSTETKGLMPLTALPISKFSKD